MDAVTRAAEGGRKMTNGDKIRGMSDKDLAWWYCKGRSCGSCPYNSSIGCTLFEWIKQDAEE